jgi:hypothetical protein
MIPVTLAPEPASFETAVRKKGLAAIAELVGETGSGKRRGPRRKPVAARREQIPSRAFPPFWTAMEDEMHRAYRGLCAYSALYIEPATGGRSIDHFVPKSVDWQLVYEWSNYRLACSRVNSKKLDQTGLLDPFLIKDGWFELEFVAFQVVAGTSTTQKIRAHVQTTIDRLGLNSRPFCEQRGAYAQDYRAGEIGVAYLDRMAPFVAREIRRQGLLRPEDA